MRWLTMICQINLMNNKKILILKNDRTGDLFVSLNAINKIINKHSNHQIEIFLSNINHKFSFLFPKLKKKKISMNLNFREKIKILYYFLSNKISDVYILAPKNFYYYLPFIFRNIKFHAITIKSLKSRPNKFLKNYLYKYIELDRLNIKKRRSSYDIQSDLIDIKLNKDFLNKNYELDIPFIYPKNYVYFHYKLNLFENLLKWDLQKICKFLEVLSKKYDNVLFSSEFNNSEKNLFFSKKFNTYDFDQNTRFNFNKKNIFFLKNIDGYNLYHAVKKSSKIISPEGIITHMGYFLDKEILALMHFNLNDRQDFINQIISCKEWFPPKNYQFIVLKKDFDKSLSKLLKRI